MPEFCFDAKNHIYTLDAKRLISVTQVFAELGIINTKYFTKKSRDRGTVVHVACQYLDEGDLDWKSLEPIEKKIDEPIIGYVKAWENFVRETGWVSKRTEVHEYHATYLYAGTADNEGYFPDEAKKTGVHILEKKTGVFEKCWESQLSGYEGMAEQRIKDGPIRKTAVQLFSNESYKLHPFSDPNSWQEFLIYMTAAKNKIKKYGSIIKGE